MTQHSSSGGSRPPLRMTYLFHDLGENIALAQYLDFFLVYLDIGAAIPAEEDFVSLDHGHLGALAVVEHLARTDREHSSALRLLFGGIGQQDAAGRLLIRFQGFHYHPVIQRSNFQIRFLGHDEVPQLRPYESASFDQAMASWSRRDTQTQNLL